MLAIQATGLLSFGRRTPPLELLPLNVLIGPNASGKSNLLALVDLLRSLPADLLAFVWDSGGIGEWVWKGASPQEVAGLRVVIGPEEAALEHQILVTPGRGTYEVAYESISDAGPQEHPHAQHFRFSAIEPLLLIGGEERPFEGGYLVQQSVLSQIRDPLRFPELTQVARTFQAFRLYRDWHLGPDAAARFPQPDGASSEYLEEDFSNLGTLLSRVLVDDSRRTTFHRHLRGFYEGADALKVSTEAGTVRILLQEQPLGIDVPAIRLSDGTLRWIVLLTILLDPLPPPLVCIEEPEVGLHPDMLPTLAHLLREASERMQLVVTTHSDALVDALSDTPESIIVCEKENGATTMRRLSREDLSAWLEKYTLGQLWRSGEIGGNRW